MTLRNSSVSSSTGTGSIVIKGEGITVDFNGAMLTGTRETVEPDERHGTGVYVEGKDITIKNLKVHGYKVGLAARNSDGLKIIDSDFSYNWKQRLKSTPERESNRRLSEPTSKKFGTFCRRCRNKMQSLQISSGSFVRTEGVQKVTTIAACGKK